MSYRHIQNLYRSTEILLFRQCYATEKIHGCLHKDTLIAAAGGYTCIKDVKEGDKVFCYNEARSEFEMRKVKNKLVRRAAGKWISISLEDGKKLIVTEDHQLLTNRGWISAKDLILSDDLISM
jgi:pyruvoyl-dependent arginine decarboxylase (PvlArgDC)